MATSADTVRAELAELRQALDAAETTLTALIVDTDQLTGRVEVAK